MSVLIPVYRGAQFLPQTIASLQAQLVTDWEAIVVDNASDDDSYELARNYSRNDPRILVYQNPRNIGPVRNWQRCVSMASAPVAGLLFADDWYEPTFLSESLRLLQDIEIGFVYSAVRLGLRGPGRGSMVAYRLPGPAKHPTIDYLRGALEPATYDVPLSPGCALARTHDLARWLNVELPDPDEKYAFLSHGAGPDVSVFLEGCLDYPSFGHIQSALVNFRAHSGNLSWEPGIRRAYAAALFHFYQVHRPPGLSHARVRARHWLLLRGDPSQADFTRQLGPTGWGALLTAALFRGVARVRRARDYRSATAR